MRINGEPLAAAIIKPLEKIQNKCLRKVIGAYKRTPRAVLEYKVNVPPLNLYMQISRYKRAGEIIRYKIERRIT